VTSGKPRIKNSHPNYTSIQGLGSASISFGSGSRVSKTNADPDVDPGADPDVELSADPDPSPRIDFCSVKNKVTINFVTNIFNNLKS